MSAACMNRGDIGDPLGKDTFTGIPILAHSRLEHTVEKTKGRNQPFLLLLILHLQNALLTIQQKRVNVCETNTFEL